MKNLFLLVSFLTAIHASNAQKMYIWCPQKLTPSPRTTQLKDVSIDLVITDSRVFTGKVKNKCNSDELKNSLFELIRSTYPSARITLISDKKSINSNTSVLIEVDITAYHATFTTPMWFAQTDFSVKIKNLKATTPTEFSKDIHKEKKFFNVGGFGTAKNNLNKSYLEASIELLDFISDSLNN